MAGQIYDVHGSNDGTPHVDDGVGYHLTRSGARWIQPVVEGVVAVTDVFQAHEKAFATLGELDEAMAEIRENRSYSEFGKAEKIEAISLQALAEVAEAGAKMEDSAKRLDELEATALAPVPLPAGDLAAVMADFEIRAWFMAKPETARMQLVEKLDPRVQAALLRSPVPIGDIADKVLREVWAAAKRVEDPEQHARIAAGRKAVDWTRRGLAQMAGASLQVTGLKRDRLLWLVTSSKRDDAQRGLGIFGIRPDEVAEMKLRAHADGRLRRAA